MLKLPVSFLLLCALCCFQPHTDAQSPAVLALPGVVPVGSSSLPHIVTVRLQANGTVEQVKVLSRGSEGLDFQAESDTCTGRTFAEGQTCTVNVAFRPSGPGRREGAVLLLDTDKHALGAQPLAAQASGAIATFVPGMITTVAGTVNSFLFSGDNGPATSASLFLPFGCALDGAGDLYIADTYNNRIRVVDGKTAVITTVAGDGISGYTGDGGPATSASLSNPSSLQLDSAGNIYFADTANNVVRMVNVSTGTISTVAGDGIAGYAGDNGPATVASLRGPNGIAFDPSGKLYIADSGNNVIRVLDPSTGLISTVAGNGTAAYAGDSGPAAKASLNNPFGVAFSSSGEWYIADQKNNAIRKVDTSGTITTIAGNGGAGNAGTGGLASAAQLSAPSGVVVDVAGNVYISDTENNVVRKVNPSTNVITTVAGSGGDGDNNPANLASLYGPYGMALDSQGNLFLADAAHNRIREISSNMGVLNYPTMHVGAVSAPMTQLLENDGTATLNISAVTAVADAQISNASTCNPSTQVAVLSQCAISAEFAPATLNVVGSIKITSDATNNPNLLKLQGGVQSTYSATVILSSSPNPSIVGNNVLVSIEVVSSSSTVATGSVTLLDGTTPVTTVQLSNGNALINLSTLSVGQHTLTVSYGGDANNSSATSAPTVQIVNPVPPNSGTMVSLVSSADPSTAGQLINLNASVAPSTAGQAVPTGSITFMDGTTQIGTSTVNAGNASIATSSLATGTHQITAVYGGSSTYSTSTSPVLTQVVVPPNSATTTSLTSNADPIVAGLSLTLTAVVSPVATGQQQPTGTVTFLDGTTSLGTSTLVSGSANLTLSTLNVASHLITAVYKGDANYISSTSPVLTEIVVGSTTGNSSKFTFVVTPPTVTVKTGTHTTLQITLTTAANFTDTVSFGCSGLPNDTTCTFSQTQFAVTGGSTKTLSLVLDTNNPLGAGSSARSALPRLFGPNSTQVNAFACLLPAGALLILFCAGPKRRRIQLFLLLMSVSGMSLLAGCGGSYSVQSTPPGSYTLQVFANGSNSGSSYVVPIKLTVTP